MRVLLVEDEPHLGSAVQEHVRAAGHAVDWFERLEPAEHAVRTEAQTVGPRLFGASRQAPRFLRRAGYRPANRIRR